MLHSERCIWLAFGLVRVSTAALVDKKIKGLRNIRSRIVELYGETCYVAVMATIPPAAPAMEWMNESLAIFCKCKESIALQS